MELVEGNKRIVIEGVNPEIDGGKLLHKWV